jgi:crotonobetainyl-CoA:carnitine CoA-transferase CaiB-like acyl-CoA transferase
MDEVFASPEGAAMVQEIDDPARGPLRLVADPIRFDGQMLPIHRPPPTLGEHSDLLDD